jgi:hypothetical protein
LDESIERYFLTGEVERNTPAWDLHLSRFFDGGERRRAAWVEHRESLLGKWRLQRLKGLPWAEKEFNNGNDGRFDQIKTRGKLRT